MNMRMKKYQIFIIVLFFFPSILVTDRTCGNITTHISQVGVYNPIATFFDLIFEFSNYGKQFDGHNTWYLDYYLLVEIYGFILVLLIYFLLSKNNFRDIRNNFKYIFEIIYSKKEIWILIFGFYFFYSLFFKKEMNSITIIDFSLSNNSNLILYIFLYITFLFFFKYFIEKFENEMKNLLTFLVILFFPVITLSNSYTNIQPCSDSQNWKYEEITIIAPLVYGLPKTLSSFFYTGNEKFDYQILVKIYSILEIILILYILPSILNLISKDKKYSC